MDIAGMAAAGFFGLVGLGALASAAGRRQVELLLPEVFARKSRDRARQRLHEYGNCRDEQDRPRLAVVPPVDVPGRPRLDTSPLPLCVVTNERTRAMLAAAVRPGQVWVRLSDGSLPERRERRRALIDAVSRTPGLGDVEVYRYGVQLGLWADDGPFEAHGARNRQRVRRIRQAAVAVVGHRADSRPA